MNKDLSALRSVLNKLPITASDKDVIENLVAKCLNNVAECKADVAECKASATVQAQAVNVKQVKNILNVDTNNIFTAKLAGTVNSILDSLREAGIMK